MNHDLLPTEFVEQLYDLLGTSATQLIDAILQDPAPISIRYNPKKSQNLTPEGEPVAWSNHGYYLESRKSFTLDPIFHAGAYYVQEASSMLVEWIVRQISKDLESPKVLDLCGAPGGKSTLLLASLPDDSLVVSNEVIRSRYPILRENLIKWGYPNKLLCNVDATAFEQVPGFFDIVLVDAPCSGEGLFRKDHGAMREWSTDNQQLCSGRQKRILASAVQALRRDGWLIYSTCTYNPRENEENIAWLQKEFNLEVIKPDIPGTWGLMDMGAGYQCFPHRVKGEGFYVACLRQKADSTFKPGKADKRNSYWQAIPQKMTQGIIPWLEKPENLHLAINEKGQLRAWPATIHAAMETLLRIFPGAEPGVAIGQLIRNDFIPAHDLIVSTLLADSIPRYELDKATALRCLKKEPIPVPDSPKGWIVAAFEGIPIALLKNLGNRTNNYFPKEWRIRMEIPE